MSIVENTKKDVQRLKIEFFKDVLSMASLCLRTFVISIQYPGAFGTNYRFLT